MATSGELRAIIEELKLVDIGDAANYLGEEATVEDEFAVTLSTSLPLEDALQPLMPSTHLNYQGHS